VAVVFHAQAGVFARCQAEQARFGGAQGAAFQQHTHLAGFIGQGLPGVGAQVQDHLLHLCTVHLHPQRFGRGAHAQAHGGWHRGAQQCNGLFHQRLQRLHGVFTRGAAAEGEHLPHQLARTLCRTLHQLQALTRR